MNWYSTFTTVRFYLKYIEFVHTVCLPDYAITRSSTHNVPSDWDHAVDWQRMARKPVTDVSPLPPVENVDHPFWGTTQNFLITLKFNTIYELIVSALYKYFYIHHQNRNMTDQIYQVIKYCIIKHSVTLKSILHFR